MIMNLKKFINIFLILTLIYLSNFNQTLAQKYENLYLLSFNLQSFTNSLKENLKNLLFFNDNDDYKEKYYQLLKKIAQLKIVEQEKIFNESLDLLKKRFPNAQEVKGFSKNLGLIYAQYKENLSDKAFVVDSNWLLVGKVDSLTGKYLKIISLNYAGFQLGVSTLEGQFLGLAKSTGLGYLIVDKVDVNINIDKDDFIMTAGNDELFPKGFLVGQVFKVESSPYFKKVYIYPLANFNEEKLIILQ